LVRKEKTGTVGVAVEEKIVVRIFKKYTGNRKGGGKWTIFRRTLVMLCAGRERGKGGSPRTTKRGDGWVAGHLQKGEYASKYLERRGKESINVKRDKGKKKLDHSRLTGGGGEGGSSN